MPVICTYKANAQLYIVRMSFNSLALRQTASWLRTSCEFARTPQSRVAHQQVWPFSASPTYRPATVGRKRAVAAGLFDDGETWAIASRREFDRQSCSMRQSACQSRRQRLIYDDGAASVTRLGRRTDCTLGAPSDTPTPKDSSPWLPSCLSRARPAAGSVGAHRANASNSLALLTL